MSEFEQRLNECLEALTEGRLTLDECLGKYPEHADALRAHLIAATRIANAYDAQPRAEWADAARRRFLIASGQTLQEALDVEPSASFFASARVRFLLAAQRLRRESAPARRVPVFGSPMRAFGAMAAGVVVFIGASSYTVASASAALPGDWNYGVKLQTERAKLALAITDSQERDIKLDIAEERLREIEVLASRGKIIGPAMLDRFVEHTQPLVDDAEAGKLNSDDVARLQAVSVRSTQVLDNVGEQVAPGAELQLAAARDVSDAAVSVTRDLVIGDPGRPPFVLTPGAVVRTPTPLPTDAAPTEPAGDTPTSEPADGGSDVETPDPDATPTVAPAPEAPTDSVVLGDVPMVDLGPDTKLYSLVAGRLKLLVPGAGTAWFIDNIPDSGVPQTITLKTQDQQSMVVLIPSTGDAYWYISPAGNNRFDEVQLRITRNGEVLQANPKDLKALYGTKADIPILIMQSIQLLPEPTPEPEPTAGAATPEPESPLL
jgi:hypothetical protein